MKKTLSLLFSLMFIISAYSQGAFYNQTGPATWEYDTYFGSHDLHFYLFGDGHHSFEQSVKHQYPGYINSMNIANAKLYKAKQYGNLDPEELAIHTVSTGNLSSTTVPYFTDNMVSLKQSWNPVSQKERFMILTFENKTPENAINGCIEFHYHENDYQLNSSGILDDYGNEWVNPNETPSQSEYQNEFTNKLVWEFSDLQHNEQRMIYIPIKCLASTMDLVKNRAVMKIRECDGTIHSSTQDGSLAGVDDSPIYTYSTRVATHPHDPNCIVPLPSCLKQKAVRYKIYFQNEGITAATNVNLDFNTRTPIQSVKLIDASNNCILQTGQPTFDNFIKLVEIDFHGIMLPGLMEEPAPKYPSTIGWVIFDVCYYVPEGIENLNPSCINTSVDIVFDAEAPVTATNSLCTASEFCDYSESVDGVDMDDILNVCNIPLEKYQVFVVNPREIAHLTNVDFKESKFEFEIAPNPSSNRIHIITDTFKHDFSITILNSIGQKMNDYSIDSNTIEIRNFENGVYYILIVDGAQRDIKKFIKL